MKRTNNLVKIIAGTAIFAALTVVLTIISNYININGTAINLALIPVVLAGIIYGPISGLIVGLFNGVIVIMGAGAYMAISPLGTILVCLTKSGLAGLISALVFKAIAKKNFEVGCVVASLLAPVINTSIFIVGALIFFNGVFGELISIFIGLNFIIEFVLNIVFSPFIMSVIRYGFKRGYAR